jgi:chromate reductase
MEKQTVLAFSGSLRKASINSGLVRAIKAQAPANMTVEIIDIGTLPLYNQDMEAQYPADIAALKEKIRSAAGIVIATPEYNRSIPGALKNLFDWTSRPYGEDAWKGKAVAVVGASLGPIGTALAQYHLKQILAYLGTHSMGQPEFYVGSASDKFNASGDLTDEKTKEYITRLLGAFEAHMSLFAKK